MSIGVCPGSYDPITFGHVDVVRRARSVFDEVIVGVARNQSKRYLFDDEERLELARQAVSGIGGVRVEFVPGLLADFVRHVGGSAIVKGLRGSADYDDEQSMALLNRHLSGVETVFILGDPGLAHISSSHVKDIARYGGNVEDLVPSAVARALAGKEY